jgi:DNA-binding transcriptional LysR family regulator
MRERPDPVPGIDRLELRQLRHFLALAEERNFTRAAERLHIAQQGLSASIRRFEDQLGVQLFERSTRHVTLTPGGEALVAGARAVLDAASEALEQVRLVSEGRSGRLRVGFSTAAGGVAVVREILRTFAAQAGDVDVRTFEHDFSDPSAGLVNDTVEVAFVFGPVAADSVSSITLLEEPRLLAVHPEHPLAARMTVTQDDLLGLPWLQVPAPRGPWTEFWFPSSTEGPPGPTIRTADEWVAAIEAGRGVAFTLPTVMRNFTTARITVLPTEGLPPATLLLTWRTMDRDPLVRAFVACARGIVGSRSPG